MTDTLRELELHDVPALEDVPLQEGKKWWKGLCTLRLQTTQCRSIPEKKIVPL